MIHDVYCACFIVSRPEIQKSTTNCIVSVPRLSFVTAENSLEIPRVSVDFVYTWISNSSHGFAWAVVSWPRQPVFAVVVACGFHRQQKKFTNVRKLVQLCIYQCACKSNRLKNNICTARNTIQFRRIWAKAFVNYYQFFSLCRKTENKHTRCSKMTDKQTRNITNLITLLANLFFDGL